MRYGALKDTRRLCWQKPAPPIALALALLVVVLAGRASAAVPRIGSSWLLFFVSARTNKRHHHYLAVELTDDARPLRSATPLPL